MFLYVLIGTFINIFIGKKIIKYIKDSGKHQQIISFDKAVQIKYLKNYFYLSIKSLMGVP